VVTSNWHLIRGTLEGSLFAMKTKQFIFTVMMVSALATPALAQDVGTGAPAFGVGAEQQLLGGATGAAMVYDMGQLRVDGILGFESSNRTKIDLAGRLLWVAHRSGNADFSLGGGLGLVNIDPDGPADSTTNFHVEGLGQIRVFVVPNVAISTTFGFGIGLNDGQDTVAFGGQFLTNAGLIYYFR